MRIIRFLPALALCLIGFLLLVVAVTRADVLRLLIGAGGYRLHTLGAALCVVVSLAGLVLARPDARRIQQRIGQITTMISAAALVLFLRQFPVHTIEPVRYASGDIHLAGDFHRPQSPSPWAAVVLVHGSASFSRRFYDVWADFLVTQGVAVVLVDKRGAGDSGGVFVSNNNGSHSNLSLLADDVCAGVDYLLQRDDIDRQRIGLFGISQAGWVSVLAAHKCPAVQFIVTITGPTVSVGEESVWSDLRGDDQVAARVSIADAEQKMNAVAPTGYDPRAQLQRLNIPGLWLFGDQDNSIPTAKSVAVLEQLIAAGKPFDFRTYPNVGHALIGHGNGPPVIAAQSWVDLRVWLAQYATAAPQAAAR